MVRALRPQPYARPVIEPEPTLFWLLLWDFQPFLPPYAFNALVIYMPAAVIQQPGNHAIPIAAELFGQCGDVLGQSGFVRQTTGHLALRRAMLTQCSANPALRYAEGLPHMINALPAAGRA
jgi:hypothetical protein